MTNIVILKCEDGTYIKNPQIDGLKIDFFGQDNLIEIHEGSVFHNTHIKCYKSCNIKIYKTHPRGIRNTLIDMIGSYNAGLTIKENTSIESARFSMSNEDNVYISIGKGCMLSSNIVFRATDGHVILDKDFHSLLNKSKPIYIGDYVWIGSGVTILKGVQVSNHTIIGTMSLVTKKYKESNVAIAGNPAKIVKTNISWDRTYIKNWLEKTKREQPIFSTNNTDRFRANTILRNLDIWNNNDNVDPFKLNPLFTTLFLNAEFDQVKILINELKDAPFFEKIAIRVGTVESQLNGILSFKDNIKNDPGIQQVILKPYILQQMEIPNFENICDLDIGLYKKSFQEVIINHFDDNFGKKNIDTAQRDLFRGYGFNKPIRNSVPEKIRVMNNIRVHSYHENFYAISDMDGFYDRENSARLAKLTGLNTIINNKLVIDKAIIMPFEQATTNYYHNIAEMVYGIRFAEHSPRSYKVIYTKDKFGAFKYLANQLGIDNSRLISLQELDGALISKAIHIHPIGYSWNRSIYDFFARFRIKNNKSPKKVYISRKDSSRKFNNEEEIERFLKKQGFAIIQAENLTFEQQVELFSNTKILVAGHGAGITNILFMDIGTTLIELFPEKIVKPDFYFRSIHNKMKYQGVIAKDNAIDLKMLHRSLLSLQ